MIKRGKSVPEISNILAKKEATVGHWCAGRTRRDLYTNFMKSYNTSSSSDTSNSKSKLSSNNISDKIVNKELPVKFYNLVKRKNELEDELKEINHVLEIFNRYSN